MKRQLLYCSYSLIFIILNLYSINSETYCNSGYFCNQCQFCGQRNMDYDSCFYYELFCNENKNNKKNLTYSPNLKNEYIDYFSLDYDAISFCGTKDFNIKNMEPKNNEIIIFTTKNKNYQNYADIHCHFLINLENSRLLYPNITFTNNNNNYRNYQISYIYTYNNQVRSQKSDSFSSIDINYFRTVDIGTAITLEIFVDFFESYSANQKTDLEIKINFEKKFLEDEVNKVEDDSSSSDKVAMGAGIGSGVVIFWVVVCCCYKHCCDGKK